MRSIPVKGVKAESSMTQSLLREATQKKIAYLVSKHAVKDVDVYVIIKDFFKEYLHVHYEFTFDELAQELNKTYIEKHVKEALYRLLEDFSTIEYKDEEIPQETLHNVLGTFSKLVDDLIKQQSTKKGFFGRLFGKKEDKMPHKTLVHEDNVKGVPVEEVEQLPTTDIKEEVKEEKLTIDDVDIPEPKKEDDATIKDGFQTPSISQEPPTSPPIDFGEEPKEEETTVTSEKKDQGSAFPEENVSEKEESIRQTTGWKETAEPVYDTETSNDNEKFPFANENEELHEKNPSHKNPDAEDAILQPTTPTEEPARQEGEQADIVSEQRLTEEAQEDAILQQATHEFVSEQPVEQPPVQEVLIEEAPTNPTPEQPTEKVPAIPSEQEKTDVYFGSGEEELSADLNKLAEQLDEVIHDEDLKPQPGAVIPANDLKQLITETERLIVEKQFDEAKNVYKELVGRYHELPEDDKHQYYDDVQHLYDLLQ